MLKVGDQIPDGIEFYDQDEKPDKTLNVHERFF